MSCGLISCFIVGMPFCPYQFGRKISALSVPKRKPNVDNYVDIINQITIDNENVVVLRCKSNSDRNEFVDTRK